MVYVFFAFDDKDGDDVEADFFAVVHFADVGVGGLDEGSLFITGDGGFGFAGEV